ncbi:MAG TPA: hypothetical protein VF290_02520 [Pyrinomonadaceae bacterium]
MTVEEALTELLQTFPERDGLQVTEHAWFWKERGRVQRSARIMLGPEYNAPKFESEGEAPLEHLIAQVREWKESQPS